LTRFPIFNLQAYQGHKPLLGPLREFLLHKSKNREACEGSITMDRTGMVSPVMNGTVKRILYFEATQLLFVRELLRSLDSHAQFLFGRIEFRRSRRERFWWVWSTISSWGDLYAL
jgi:hypothetical protein